MSKRDAPVAIISMAQQARPNVIGHMLDSRAQLIACSRVVVKKFSSARPSSQPISATPCLLCECASYPIEVSSFPQVSEADQENPEKDQDIPEGEPSQIAPRFRCNRRQILVRDVSRRAGGQELPR